MILCYWLLSSSKKKISFLMLSTVSMLSHVLCLVAQSSLDFLPSAWPVACQAPLSMKILQARILEWVAMPSSRVFPTQGLNAGLLHCRWILYHLSHKGSPRILEWVAYRFSKDLPDPGIKLGSPALQADSLPVELPGKPCVNTLLWKNCQIIFHCMAIPHFTQWVCELLPRFSHYE